MPTNAFCPISFKKIDENVARLNGLLTVVLLIVYVLTGSLLPVAFLAIDFAARGFEKPSWSLLARISKKTLSLLQVKVRPMNAGPKLFAARIGLLFSVMVLISALAGWNIVALVIAAIFGICAFLEASIGFCVACKIYPFIYKFTYQKSIDKIDYKSDYQI